MKLLKRISTVFFVWAALVGMAQNVQAVDVDILGRPFHLNGFIQQAAGMGVGNSKLSGRLQSAYSLFQVEWSWQLSDKISLYSINRLTGDMAYNINHSKGWWQKYNETPTKKTRSRKRNEWEWNRYDKAGEILREIYLDIFLEKWSFRIGKQQVVWGETDGLRLMDVINPLDNRREFNLYDSDEGYEHSRIPLWMVKAMYFPDWEPLGIRDLQYEFIFLPGKTRSNRLEAYQADGGVWAADEPNLPYLVKVNIKDKRPGFALRNAEFALRIMGDYKKWIFTLNAYYGRQHDAYIKPVGAEVVDPRSSRNDGRLLQVNIQKKYAWRRIVGFTLNRELEWIKFRGTTAPVLRVESIYELDKTFINEGEKVGDVAWTGLNPNNGVYKRGFDEIRTMLGLDWNIYIRPLNKRESFFFSAQFFFYHIPNQSGVQVNAPFYYKNSVKTQPIPGVPGKYFKYNDPWRVHKTQKYCSLGIATNYDNKRFVPYVLMLYDMEEHAFGMKAKLNFNYGEHWRPEVGFMTWHGDHDTGKSMGLFQKNTQTYAKIKYQF